MRTFYSGASERDAVFGIQINICYWEFQATEEIMNRESSNEKINILKHLRLRSRKKNVAQEVVFLGCESVRRVAVGTFTSVS